LRRADVVLVASRDMARRVREHGLDPRVVHNPVAGDRLARALEPAERARWRAELGVGERLAVAMVGRLDPQKRVELALRAILALPTHMAVTLLIAGQGSAPYEERVRRLWREQRGSEPPGPHEVRWLGHRTDVAE